MELKSWLTYDSSSNKCCIVCTKPFDLNLSDKCRKDFDDYLSNKYSLKDGSYGFVDIILDIGEFCEKTDYKINIHSEINNSKKILIDEIRPRPIRHVDDIDNLINPFF